MQLRVSAFSFCRTTDTETQKTQRLHREGSKLFSTLVYNIPARLIDQYADYAVIVRSRDPSEIVSCLPPARLFHVRFVQLLSLPPDISVLGPWAVGLPIDVVLSDPVAEYSRLYSYATLSETHPVRVTIPVISGFSKAVRLAVALGFAVKFDVIQPDDLLIEELSDVLDFYLHGKAVQQPIEFFQSMLLSFYQSQPFSMWEISEEDPAQMRYVTDDGEESIYHLLAGSVPAADLNGFVDRFAAQLLSEKRECHDCDFYGRCGGYFKWPDKSYSCDGIKKLFSSIQAAAAELKTDLSSFAVAQGGLSR